MSKTVCIISLTPVTDEPRVLRQSKALADAGWTVIVAGFKGRQAPPPHWRYIEVEHVYETRRLTENLKFDWKRRLSPGSGQFAEDYYWAQAGYDGIYEHIATIENVRCDLAIAHDYFTAPIAARLAKVSGGVYVIDCHEFSFEQYMHDPKWIKRERSWVHAMEKRFLPGASVVTTVCDGIADALKSTYKLAHRPTVVRSTAFYHDLPFRPTGEKIEVLYHGIVSPMRGLEQTIESVKLWNPEYHFVIRGPGPDDYIASLAALAEQHGVTGRVRIDPPVAFNEMVPRANSADIGFFIQPDISLQKRFTLPNKFFEYVQARLALCVGNLPEMARLVKQYDLGVLVPEISPAAIAAQINSLTRARIDSYKQASMKAALELSWQSEAEMMLRAYGIEPVAANVD
ncbi:MAG: glycosyltransferase family 4 protein [Hyphomonas sp.]|uniref:glycosyltransferase n=1 Tax=Hyphomonas sp. TaxID=87 RepID=UPI0018237F89|nr:glycosyltransferase [Hyphomonas sp.]MBA3069138.1 glycosyltransferase family 4 protein [Hyphomonas sp.]MBU3920405.1 glycosyltransferase [Alphaproteobacteria bacterium]MBU4061553.1 glycosyltransferase [Alphaproteobacteria bacterium]MBU4165411.1 glycosyltransferase [Alphaproteobacteria bacterium]